jgi:hypothetical protein
MNAPTIISACAALAGIVLVILATGRFARQSSFVRRKGWVAGGRLRVEETLALDPRRRLVLLSCDGRGVLLLTGPQDQVVGWLPERVS